MHYFNCRDLIRLRFLLFCLVETKITNHFSTPAGAQAVLLEGLRGRHKMKSRASHTTHMLAPRIAGLLLKKNPDRKKD